MSTNDYKERNTEKSYGFTLNELEAALAAIEFIERNHKLSYAEIALKHKLKVLLGK